MSQRELSPIIFLLMICYVTFVTLRFGKANDLVGLVITFILMAGGAFVLIVAHLSAITARDTLRLANLENDVIRDPLTGAFNRRYMEVVLKEEMAKARRHQRPLSVLLVDLDHFKRINDTYGHAVGDHVLKYMADPIVDGCRDTDIVIRYGGEEFPIIALDSDLDASVTLGERLVSQFVGTSIPLPGITPFIVTASVEVACLNNDENQVDFIARADKGCYAAKRGGRNRRGSLPVVICPPPEEESVPLERTDDMKRDRFSIIGVLNEREAGAAAGDHGVVAPPSPNGRLSTGGLEVPGSAATRQRDCLNENPEHTGARLSSAGGF